MKPLLNELEKPLRRLNLGADGYPLSGWESVGLGGQNPVDFNVTPWPFEDGIAIAINASHVLEHLTKENGKRFLSECYRILAVGGVLTLAVPDMDKFVTARITGDFTPLNGYKWTDLNHLMGGDNTEKRDHWRHKYMYTFESLAYAMNEAGFEQVGKRPFSGWIDNPAYTAISLYMRGSK